MKAYVVSYFRPADRCDQLSVTLLASSRRKARQLLLAEHPDAFGVKARRLAR